MGIGSRPATCASCGKRLTRKHWYYRNGKYFCKKRCWVTDSEKAQAEAAKAEGSKETSKPEASKEASAAS